MSRWISALNEAAAERSDIYGCWLLDLAFDSGHVRANDSGIDLSFGGNSYSGVGTFGTFDPIEEALDFVARGKRFELTGIDSGIVATIMSAGDTYQGRAATLYVGLIDPDTTRFVDTPEVDWSGYMDTMDIEPDGADSKIVLQCEHRLRNAPLYSRQSDADQKARSPGDRFYDLTHLVSGYVSNWGGKSTTWNTGPGGGRTPG